jgi:hypothetical protein
MKEWELHGAIRAVGNSHCPTKLRRLVAFVQIESLSSNQRSAILQRPKATTLAAPPPSAMATRCFAVVSMIVLFSSWYWCRS